MKSKPLIILDFLLLFILLFYGCKNNPSTPPEKETDCTSPPGNRNFVWKADTVAIFPSWMGGVWAFSDSDAYVMGSIYLKDDNGNLQGYFGLHWDGKTWDKNINGTVFEINHNCNDLTGDSFYMVSVGFLGYNNPRAAIGEFDNRIKKWKSFIFETPGELRSVWTDKKGYFIAGGDNGMVYIKDGYTSSWNYNKIPTDFSLVRVDGVNKKEIYFLGLKYHPTGEAHNQIWKYYENNWIKLYDSEDSLKSIINYQGTPGDINDIKIFRCTITDSLYMFMVGHNCYLLTSHAHSSKFETTNLVELGLLDFTTTYPAIKLGLFSLNDVWVGGLKYDLYHWNGFNFQKMQPFPYFASGGLIGAIVKITKSSSGKIWILIETTSQTFQIVQGEIY